MRRNNNIYLAFPSEGLTEAYSYHKLKMSSDNGVTWKELGSIMSQPTHIADSLSINDLFFTDKQIYIATGVGREREGARDLPLILYTFTFFPSLT